MKNNSIKNTAISFKQARVLALIVFLVTAALASIAGPLTVLYTFPGPQGDGTLGSSPNGGLIWRGDGLFYGTTHSGGGNGEGTLFSISPLGTFTSVYQFASDSGGYAPFSGVTLDGPQSASATFFGTSYSGGTSSRGAVLQLDQVSSTSWQLEHYADFTAVVNEDGGNPEGALIQGNDGNFYGTTTAGGTNDYGTIYVAGNLNYPPPAGGLTEMFLYEFTGGMDGKNPIGALVQGSDGNFYGTTQFGSVSNYGTVFQYTFFGLGHPSVQNRLNTLHIFTGGADGGYPLGGLVQGSDGQFYGVTHYGGTIINPQVSGGGGTVFKISSSGVFTLLHSFGDTYANGPLIQGIDGNFYGTTSAGVDAGTNGSVYQITPAGVFTTVWQFNGTDGRNPSGALLQYFNGFLGYLYGTTTEGGANYNGTIFSLFIPSFALTNQIIGGQIGTTNQSGATGQTGVSGFSAIVPSAAGLNYQLQSVGSLSGASWVNVGSQVPGTGTGALILNDPAAVTNSQGFYRVFSFPGNPIVPQ